MRSLSISGASTKIPAIAGAATYVLEDKMYDPDVMVGTSAGAILQVPLALGMYDVVKEWTTSFDEKDVFSVSPVNKRGNISFRGIMRALLGRPSFGSQKNLIKTYSKIVTPSLFQEYKKDKYPDCYVGYVEYKTCKRIYRLLKECSYEDFLLSVNASSSIPVFVEPVVDEGNIYYDGGVRDHIGSYWLMTHVSGIEKNISIYSRPRDFNHKDLSWRADNIAKVLKRTIEIMQIEISKSDEMLEEEYAKRKGIKNNIIYMPNILTEDTYAMDKRLLKVWYDTGYEAAKRQYYYGNKNM